MSGLDRIELAKLAQGISKRRPCLAKPTYGDRITFSPRQRFKQEKILVRGQACDATLCPSATKGLRKHGQIEMFRRRQANVVSLPDPSHAAGRLA
jgi:hypothetical protein